MNNDPEQNLSRRGSVRGRLSTLLQNLSLTERTIFYVLSAILIASAAYLAYSINESFMVEIPGHGGNLTEGIVGTPRFINPILAISDADRDLTELVYSGLLKPGPGGTYIPDLAQSYTVSSDGLTYDFILRSNATFHDGTPVTADDVVFTIQKAEDPDVKSPKRADWDGVDVEKVSDHEVRITLKQPYAPFLENATLGILPKHIWQNISADQFPFSQYNVEPIGSGPYRYDSYQRNNAGVPTSYKLTSFKNYALGSPYIASLTFVFYPDEDTLYQAVTDGAVDSAGSISSAEAVTLHAKGYRMVTAPLPRVFALFFNQNQAPVLANKEVRQALSMVADKQTILGNVLDGYGVILNGPIPPSTYDPTAHATSTDLATASSTIAAAKALLEKNGWKLGPDGVYAKKTKKETQALVFSITTSNAPELKQTAGLLAQEFAQIGAQVTVKVFEPGELNQSVIRPRNYDSLLFGEIVGRNPDLFAFWHSSQRNDPGLNIALYTNIQADQLLEEARAASSTAGLLSIYTNFESDIAKDMPAIFLYSPDFIYVVPDRLQGISLGALTTPSERFLSIPHWYVQTDKVWSVFAPKQ